MSEQALRFFLGGHDLEMLEIVRLLEEHAQPFEDLGLAWGSALSAYAPSIVRSIADGDRPVAVELADDMPADWPPRSLLRVVDHHGARAGAEVATSLEQVAEMIGAPEAAQTRWRRLVSANDREHIAGMKTIGATAEEIGNVRAADRSAQGVTRAHEHTAQTAIEARRIHGRLTIVEVDLPSATAVSDLVSPALGGPGADRLLVVLPEKLAAYGDGAMIAALAQLVPGSWWGGALPRAGFWGAARGKADLPAVLDIIQKTA